MIKTYADKFQWKIKNKKNRISRCVKMHQCLSTLHHRTLKQKANFLNYAPQPVQTVKSTKR